MKLRALSLQTVFTTAMLAYGFQTVQAQTSVATVPVGYMNFTIPAGGPTTPVATFSIPLTGSVPSNFVGQATGAITSVTASTITNSSAAWSPAALSQPASPYFIRITKGAAIGRTLLVSSTVGQENTATVVTVDNQGTPLNGLGIVAGDTYEIFPADTLFSLFGSDVQGGSSTANADVVRLQSGTGWLEYYYDSTAAQWRLNNSAVSQNNVVIRPDTGIMFYRRGTTPLALTLLGRVPATDVQVVLNGSGPSFAVTFPTDTTLAQAGFESIAGWVKNTGSIPAADKVSVLLNGRWNYYNYNQAAGQWRNGAVPVNMGATVIPAGVPVIVDSPTGAPGTKVWKRALPYNLSAS